MGKKGRGRACQTQRSVVEGEEQEVLMWTKKTDEKKMATSTCESKGERKCTVRSDRVIYQSTPDAGGRPRQGENRSARR